MNQYVLDQYVFPICFRLICFLSICFLTASLLSIQNLWSGHPSVTNVWQDFCKTTRPKLVFRYRDTKARLKNNTDRRKFRFGLKSNVDFLIQLDLESLKTCLLDKTFNPPVRILFPMDHF